MTIELTEQQQQALAEELTRPARVVDPRTRITYILVPEEEYEAVRESLDEERRRQAVHAAALRNAMGRMDDLP